MTSSQVITQAIIVIIISAILFVTIIALYDILRNAINGFFSNRALTDPKAQNTTQDITRTNIINYYTFRAVLVFGLFCLLSAFIFVPILVTIVKSLTIENEK